MTIYQMILQPIVGAMIGFFTNWIAIKMLFRPYEAKYLFKGKFRVPFTPGLIPKERENLAKKVAETTSQYVLTSEVLEASLNSPEIDAKINDAVNSIFAELKSNKNGITQYIPSSMILQLKDLLHKNVPKIAEYICRLPNDNPDVDEKLKTFVKKIGSENFGTIVGMFVNYDKIYLNIKESVSDYLESEDNKVLISEKICEYVDLILTKDLSSLDFSKEDEIKAALIKFIKIILDKCGIYVINSINFEKMIQDKINTFKIDEAEKIILSVVSKELNAITIMGGILGFIIGFSPVIMQLVSK